MQEQKRNQQKNQRSDESSETKIYLTPDSTLQTPEEDRHDKSIDPRKEDRFEISNDDLHETDTDRFRENIFGTSEGKDKEGENDE